MGNIVDAVFHRENYPYGQSLQMTARMEFTLDGSIYLKSI